MTPSPPPPAAPTLLVGCGYVGGAWLAAAAAGGGANIWVLARTPRPLPAGVTGIWGDLHDPDLAGRLPATLATVIFAAAADRHDPAGYRALYVEGTRRLIASVASRRRPPRLIWTSSSGVFGHDAGGWVDEATVPAPTSWRGEIILEAEGLVAAAPLPSVRLRLAGIYGPGRMRLLERLRAGWQPGAAGARFTNRIHRDDCAGVLAHVAALAAPPPLCVVADDAPATLAELAAFVAGAAAPPPPASPRGKRCRNRLLGATGYRLRVPTYRDGFALADDGTTPAGGRRQG